MSYDFTLFRNRAGVDPREIACADEVPEAGPRDPAAEALKRRVADALRAFDSALDEQVLNHDAISKLHKMRIDEAYERFRCGAISIFSAARRGTRCSIRSSIA